MSYLPPQPTEKQLDILWRLSQGYSNRMIADSMGISFHTAKSHLRSLYRKMGVHTRSGAVAIAIRNGWIE